MNKDIMVSICTQAFNQEKYIRDCLEGFIMQKTSFNYEILIHDDASTDHTADIIKEYIDKHPRNIKAVFQSKNQMSLGVNSLTDILFPMTYGKYIALCEGDDYWIDPYKLQKQFDFLENNPDYGLVHTEINQFYEKTGQYFNNFNKLTGNVIPDGDIYEFLLMPNKYFIKTPSVMFKKKLFDEYVDYNYLDKEGIPLIDLYIWLEISKNAKIGYLEDTTAVYRVRTDSFSNFSDIEKAYKFSQNVFKIRNHYANKYGCSDYTKKLIKKEKIKNELLFAYRMSNKKLAIQEIKKYFFCFTMFKIKESVLVIIYCLGAISYYVKKIINLFGVIK